MAKKNKRNNTVAMTKEGTHKLPKTVNPYKVEVVRKRINDMLRIRSEVTKHVEDYHVILQDGNDKTGCLSKTVSLIPIADCGNCSGCSLLCYDVRNDCWRDSVRYSRAVNSAIYHADHDRFWREIMEQVEAEGVTFLRINVGGDLRAWDYPYLREMGERFPDLTVQFFTKMYDEVNAWYDAGNRWPANIRCIFSRWEGMECNNPYHFPESHILWKDGRTTAPEFGAYYCSGNCTECKLEHKGCPALRRFDELPEEIREIGEHVILPAH